MSRLITMGVLICILGVQTLSAQYPMDESFGEDGIRFIDQADDMIVLSNGNILVFDGSQDSYTLKILAFDNDGNTLQSFGDYGTLKLEFETKIGFRMAVAAENNEWYMWLYKYVNYDYYDSIFHFNERGERIKEYGINGAASLPMVERYTPGNMLILRSGELMVTGELEAFVTHKHSRFIYKLTTDGKLDPQFGDAGIVVVNNVETSTTARSIFFERRDGSILVGNTVTPNNYVESEIEVFTKWGAPDSSFGNDGKVVLSPGTNVSELSSFWYDESSEVLYILTYGVDGEVFVWQLNYNGVFNYLYDIYGHKKSMALSGAQTIYKLSDGFLFTGTNFIDYYFQSDLSVWKTNGDLVLTPWPSGDLAPFKNLQEPPDWEDASDDFELRSLMLQDGSILILCKSLFHGFNLPDYPNAALIKIPNLDQPRTDLCPLLSVPVLYHDQEQSFLQLTLDPLASGDFTFSVTDMMGRTVIPHFSLDLAHGISNYTYPIPLELPNGMYLLTIHADDCATGIKFVK